MSSMFTRCFGDTPAYTNLPLLGIVDGVVFPRQNAAWQFNHQSQPGDTRPPQSCLPEDPHGAQIGWKDPLASAEVTMQQAYHVCWVSGETSVWAQSWKAKAQSEPFTFKANRWSKQGVNRCSFLSLPLGSQLKTKSGSLPTSAKSSGPKMTLKMPPATSLTDPFIALIQKGCWDLCIMALLECRGNRFQAMIRRTCFKVIGCSWLVFPTTRYMKILHDTPCMWGKFSLCCMWAGHTRFYWKYNGRKSMTPPSTVSRSKRMEGIDLSGSWNTSCDMISI